MEFKKTWEIQKWFIDYNDTLYPYTIQYVWEHEKDWSLFRIKFLGINQRFPESDLDLFFSEISQDVVEEYLESLNEEKQSLTVRFYKRNIDFLKEYWKQKDLPYQTLIRNAVDEYTSNLQKNLHFQD